MLVVVFLISFFKPLVSPPQETKCNELEEENWKVAEQQQVFIVKLRGRTKKKKKIDTCRMEYNRWDVYFYGDIKGRETVSSSVAVAAAEFFTDSQFRIKKEGEEEADR